MTNAMTSEPCAGSEGAQEDPADSIHCACCDKVVQGGEWKACASCRKPICSGCTRWYGHFMLVCDDCRLAPW